MNQSSWERLRYALFWVGFASTGKGICIVLIGRGVDSFEQDCGLCSSWKVFLYGVRGSECEGEQRTYRRGPESGFKEESQRSDHHSCVHLLYGLAGKEVALV